MTYQWKAPENLQERSMTYQLKVPENLQERSMTYQLKVPENLQERSMTYHWKAPELTANWLVQLVEHQTTVPDQPTMGIWFSTMSQNQSN